MARKPQPALVVASELPGARGGLATAAAVGIVLAGDGGSVVLAELGARRRRQPTVLASSPARALEDRLRAAGHAGAAARGRLCWLALDGGQEGLAELGDAVAGAGPSDTVVAHLPPALWTDALDALGPAAGVLRANIPADRALAALAVAELRERGARARIASRAPGRVATRRALAGVEPGGGVSRRAARMARGLLAGGAGRRRVREGAEAGQALLLTLGAAFAVIFAALVLAALGGAVTSAARVQRGADLAALSGARSLRDDLPSLLAPARLAGGAPNPGHAARNRYLARARVAALEGAERNGLDPAHVVVSFPDRGSLVPVRVRIEVRAEGTVGAERDATSVEASAEAEAAPPAGFDGMPAEASGGGYTGPLAYRQGKPMRPDVAAAFDRMAAAARADGIGLVINSGYRSDAEQARLFAQNPDPRWVAPPGQSLHRCATELDLGPPSAYGWLAANAGRFGFVRRYAWEPWHYGFTRGPEPCSATGNGVAKGTASDGRGSGPGGLPAFVPALFRGPILAAAARWNVSAGLLAAQLMAESAFDPGAVSPAGAQGIAQFMPGTAAAYGLRDPFDARAAIDAQAHLISDLLARFGSVPLALAAYNAGPAAVSACGCVPAYPETQAYVARIIGLMGAAGELATPPLEVRLVG